MSDQFQMMLMLEKSLNLLTGSEELPDQRAIIDIIVSSI